MENQYNLNFSDTDYFNYISQFTKDNFNFDIESSKIRQPFKIEIKLKDKYPDFKNIPEYKDSDPDEIFITWSNPNTPIEALKYLIECDGKLSFLYQVNKFLKKYPSFQETFLKAWMVDLTKKESLSKNPTFIAESFEKKERSYQQNEQLNPEHYYCRLRNNYYADYPEELLKSGYYDAGKVSFEYGVLMFYEFANYLLSQKDELSKPKKDINLDTLSIKEQKFIINQVKEIINFFEEHKISREDQIRYIEKHILAAQTNIPKAPEREYYIDLLEHHLARLNGTAADKYIYKNSDHQIETDKENIDLYGQPTKHANVFKNELGRLNFDKLLNEWKEDERRRLANFSFLFRHMKERENLIASTLRDSDFRLWLNETYEIDIPQTKTWERCQTKEKIRLYNSTKANIINSNTTK